MYLTVNDASGNPQLIAICDYLPGDNIGFYNVRTLARTLTGTKDDDVLLLKLVDFTDGKGNLEKSEVDNTIIPFELFSRRRFKENGVYAAHIPEGVPLKFTPVQILTQMQKHAADSKIPDELLCKYLPDKHLPNDDPSDEQHSND